MDGEAQAFVALPAERGEEAVLLAAEVRVDEFADALVGADGPAEERAVAVRAGGDVVEVAVDGGAQLVAGRDGRVGCGGGEDRLCLVLDDGVQEAPFTPEVVVEQAA